MLSLTAVRRSGVRLRDPDPRERTRELMARAAAQEERAARMLSMAASVVERHGAGGGTLRERAAALDADAAALRRQCSRLRRR